MKVLRFNIKRYVPEILESIREWPRAQGDRSTERRMLRAGKADPYNPK
jgi:hypothetical protein